MITPARQAASAMLARGLWQVFWRKQRNGLVGFRRRLNDAKIRFAFFLLGLFAVLVPVARAGTDLREQALWQDFVRLAADDMQGRLTGSTGAERARAFILHRFAEAGLAEPANGHLQTFHYGHSQQHTGVNVIAWRRGCVTADRYVIISAHYDHLGVVGGRVHNGADDNASGVAGLLELARRSGEHCPALSLIFLATDAEEPGLHGARAFLDALPFAREQIAFTLNMDMIARGGKQRKLVLAGAKRFPGLLAHLQQRSPALKLVAGHERASRRDNLAGMAGVDWPNASDHAVFRRAGIPWLYFGVDTHRDYHTPEDDSDRVDPAFLAAAVESIWQSLIWLQDQPDEFSGQQGN